MKRPANVQTDSIQLEPLAEGALLLRLGKHVDVTINARVHAAGAMLQRQLPSLECIPAYASVLLRFDPQAWRDANATNPHSALERAVRAALDAGEISQQVSREQEIPVCYGGTHGPDLAEAARHLDLSINEVITRHAAASYHVAMIGFAPGFPYLLGLDPTLVMPRRNDPRQRVPAGSVAIGGAQTGIYPTELPGGWQLIGRTPLRLFDVTATSPSLLTAGDRVRFCAIDEDEFLCLEAGLR
ncbi:MAG: 5-oxoprolinase subunit PxpB [Rhodanobacter sp.]